MNTSEKLDKLYELLIEASKVATEISKEERKHTKYEVVFWLNPQEQQIYDANWYTVEQLDQWAKGEGPVIKTKVEKMDHWSKRSIADDFLLS